MFEKTLQCDSHDHEYSLVTHLVCEESSNLISQGLWVQLILVRSFPYLFPSSLRGIWFDFSCVIWTFTFQTLPASISIWCPPIVYLELWFLLTLFSGLTPFAFILSGTKFKSWSLSTYIFPDSCCLVSPSYLLVKVNVKIKHLFS